MQTPDVLGYIPNQIPDDAPRPNVEGEIFDEADLDYLASDVDDTIPEIWENAPLGRAAPSDHCSTATVGVPHYSVGQPVQIIPRRGNNERMKVYIRNLHETEPVWVIAGDSQASTPIVTAIGAVNIISAGYCIPAGDKQEYECAAPLYAVNLATDPTTVVPVTLMFEGYFPVRAKGKGQTSGTT